MHLFRQLTLVLLLGAALVSSNTIYVQNKCPGVQKVVLRGAWGRVIATGSINPGQWWSHYMDAKNCRSCNIATNTGGTLLAECKLVVLQKIYLSISVRYCRINTF
jgi:hypothetical protein